MATPHYNYYPPAGQVIDLNDSSAIDVYMKLGVVKGVRYRVRIVVPADKTHLAGVSPWAYFVAV